MRWSTAKVIRVSRENQCAERVSAIRPDVEGSSGAFHAGPGLRCHERSDVGQIVQASSNFVPQRIHGTPGLTKIVAAANPLQIGGDPAHFVGTQHTRRPFRACAASAMPLGSSSARLVWIRAMSDTACCSNSFSTMDAVARFPMQSSRRSSMLNGGSVNGAAVDPTGSSLAQPSKVGLAAASESGVSAICRAARFRQRCAVAAMRGLARIGSLASMPASEATFPVISARLNRNLIK